MELVSEVHRHDAIIRVKIGNLDKFRSEPSDRSQCADHIIEILLDIENYMG